MQLNVLAAAS